MNDNQSKPDDLAAQSVKGSAYSISASAVTLVLGFIRSVMMARLLSPDDFGVVAFALVFLNITRPLRDFGLDLALIHRRPDEESTLDEVLAVHFSLRLILTGLFVFLLLIATPVLRFLYPHNNLLISILLVLTVGEVFVALGATPTTYLRKDMRFKDLAALQVLTSLTMTIVGPLMAWAGWGVWAIVGERISGLIAATFAVWIFIQPWRMRLSIEGNLIKWYFNYGKFIFVTRIFSPIADQFDEYWIGATLGTRSLGFYSKAYEFALYPQRIMGDPIVGVVFSTFAKLQDDNLRLSKAYFRVTSLIIRVGFLFVGVLVLVADDFVRVFLGEKWTPMVSTYRIMLVYTLLYPVLSISGYLAAACGHPEFNTRVRITQVIYFVPAVVLASRLWGINGVAAATNVMLIIGLALSFHQIRKLVDFSVWRMFAVPTAALIVGGLVSWQFSRLAANKSLMQSLAEISLFLAGFGLISLLFERKEYPTQLRIFLNLLLRRQSNGV